MLDKYVIERIQWTLVELGHKIQAIEDDDEDYRENKKWIKYRQQQEELWEILRKENENQDGRYF